MKKIVFFIVFIVTVFKTQIIVAQLPNSSTFPQLETLVPVNKKLDSSWIYSLTERGNPEVCTGAKLRYIGMPIGGLFSGQLYIGGWGQLWNWDIFNDYVFTGWSGHYGPLKPSSPLQQSFSIILNGREIPLDTIGFSNISFRGEYPMAFVDYKNNELPVKINLQAFSPFIPLQTDNSSLPITILNYTITNTSKQAITVGIKGTLENFVMNRERGALNGLRINNVTTNGTVSILEESVKLDDILNTQSDHTIEDWSKADFTGWTVEGGNFGEHPFNKNNLTPQAKVTFGNLGGDGDGFVSPVLAALGNGETKPTGKMVSTPFAIDRKHLYVWIRPESNHHKAGINLLVENKVVASVWPDYQHSHHNHLSLEAIDVSSFIGKQGVIELVDMEKGSKAGATFGRIFLSDKALYQDPTTGSMIPQSGIEDNGQTAIALLDGGADINSGNQQLPAPQKLLGHLGKTITLKPGESQQIPFAIAWYFPNLHHLPSVKEQGRSYGAKFSSAADVVNYVAANREKLFGDTKLWHDTWYNSTLPYWFLDRTMIPTSSLATSTNYLLKNNRWWAFEGVGSCFGTCGHVFGYAQAIARLFPEVERSQRETVDYGPSLSKEGWIDCRGECKDGPAIDAQGFYLLRTLREHQMTTDNSFLTRVWPKAKKAMEYMINQDSGEMGIIRGSQHNTLDANWFGEVSWYNGIYLAALSACSKMATVMKETAVAARYKRIADAGGLYMTKNLFNGEYFENKLDSSHLEAINSGSGSEIDQVIGQSWAFQVGLPRVLPKKETVKSLESLWKYNFCSDVGPFKSVYKKGRNYADKGEAGMLMCTFPKSNWDLIKASGRGNAMYASYFNECMTGFEHQVAGHNLWEGEANSELVTKGLAIERAIHDRYSPAKRNPYNEVECGDHYGRAMASYGVYIAACGFTYDGPTGYIGFAPRIHPENFKCAFTSAQGWGSYSQQIDNKLMKAQIALKWGTLKLSTLTLTPQIGRKPVSAKAILMGKQVNVLFNNDGDTVKVSFPNSVLLNAGEILNIELK